ncbi:MAG: LPS export ABC transporter periplasmic protein LptC [Desulfuromonadaceae bacterium]|nr:LPS export ABC transporter periplasmic protein LptC [Desulfuromonadaceae bacterium]
MISPVYIRPLLALLVIAAVIGITTVVFQNGSHEPALVRPANQQLPHNIDVALKKARLSEIKDGLVAWELVAERVDYDKDGDTAYLTDINMVFKSDSPQGPVTVTADSGEYSSKAKNVRLKGHVHVVAEDGASFNTSSIVYTGATDKLSTSDPVIFHQQKLKLTAVGMELGVKNQRARFFSSINASIVPN